MNSFTQVQKNWNFCHPLRDDRVYKLRDSERILRKLRISSLVPVLIELLSRLGDGTAEPDESSMTASIPPELQALPPELQILAPVSSCPYMDWADLPPELQEALAALARPISQHPRVKPDLLQSVILLLCEGRYLGRRVLAHLLNRNTDDLLKRTLNPMVKAGQLQPAFASASDPRQAYTASTRNTTGITS
jgi:hypothetical protein